MSCFLLYPITTNKLVCLSKEEINSIIETYNITSFPVSYGEIQFSIKDIHSLQKFLINNEDLEDFFNAIHFGMEDKVEDYILKNSNMCNTVQNGEYALKIAHNQLKNHFLDIRYNNIYRMIWNCSDQILRSKFKKRNDSRKKIKVQRFKKIRKHQLLEEEADDIFNKALGGEIEPVIKEQVQIDPRNQVYDNTCNNTVDKYNNEVLNNPPVDVYNIYGECIVEEHLFKYFSGNKDLQTFISKEKEKYPELFYEVEKLKKYNNVYKIPFYKKALIKTISYKAREKIGKSVFSSIEKNLLFDIIDELENIDFITVDLIHKICDTTIQLFFAQKRRHKIAGGIHKLIKFPELLSQFYKFIN